MREISKILIQEEVSDGHFRLVLEAEAIATSARPGQFLHIRVSEAFDPLLRRPFSIHRVRGERTEERRQIEILYKVAGKGTRLLSKKRPGETLDIIGPLGNGFRLPLVTCQLPVLLVAGGIGVAPLLFLAEELTTTRHLPITILIGAEKEDALLCEEEFRELGLDVKIATEDGSLGHHGLVTDLLPPSSFPLPTIYACGPIPMLKEVARFAQDLSLSCQVSIETLIACGLGACLGCAIKTKDGYRRVCKDGPVFESNEVIWDEC